VSANFSVAIGIAFRFGIEILYTHLRECLLEGGILFPAYERRCYFDNPF
jgi:hypothetical protein